jgi:Recombination endonuclease VII
MAETRRCPACTEIKPLSDFPRNRATQTGYATYCKPCHNRISRDNREKHHGSNRQYQLRRRYNIDSVSVEWLILQQSGLCAICKAGAAAHIDHDHNTQQLRGILCFNCNRALGKFSDDADLLRSALSYLKMNRKATA